MNPKILKLITKGVLGVLVSTVIGYLIKFERDIADRLDARFSKQD